MTGFIFKVQANMDPNHRDRIAFMRQVSGTFKRGMKLTPSGLGKPVAIHSPILFFAQDREVADTAEPGDIIGIPNHGTLRVGDTLSEKNAIRFTGLPNFAPEILRRVALVDPGATRTAMREKAYPGEDPQTVKPPEEVASRIAELFEGDFETGHRERVG